MRFLDIGTGCGIIALMLAQRCGKHVHIDAIDIGEEEAQQARDNILQSPWPSRTEVHLTALQEYFPRERYDLIVSNPPFFVDSLRPPDKRRSLARHAHVLSFDDLLDGAIRLLATDGRFAVVLPYVEGQDFMRRAEMRDLFVARVCVFRTRRGKSPERLLIEFSRKKTTRDQCELLLYEEKNVWSEEYQALTQAFYLKPPERDEVCCL